MKELMKIVSKILFAFFILAIGLWTASLTYEEIAMLLPGNELAPWFALALFDGGALCWLLAFLNISRGLSQRAISMIMLMVDVLGAILISGARIFTGGGTAIPADMTFYVQIGVTAITALNLIAIYAYHVTDVENMEQIESQTLEDKLTENALNQAKEQLEAEAESIGLIMSKRVSERVKRNLRLATDTVESINKGGNIIDAVSYPLAAAEAATANKTMASSPLQQRRQTSKLISNLFRKVRKPIRYEAKDVIVEAIASCPKGIDSQEASEQ